MALRFTPTVAICAIGAAVAGGLLALPPVDKVAQAPLPAPVAQPGGVAVGRGDHDPELRLRSTANRFWWAPTYW